MLVLAPRKIDANTGLTARQLARALAVTPPSIAAWVERLQARGLIERRLSVRDGRVQHLQPTETGHALVNECTQRLLQAERAVLAGLSEAERAILIERLHKAARPRGRPTTR